MIFEEVLQDGYKQILTRSHASCSFPEDLMHQGNVTFAG